MRASPGPIAETNPPLTVATEVSELVQSSEGTATDTPERVAAGTSWAVLSTPTNRLGVGPMESCSRASGAVEASPPQATISNTAAALTCLKWALTLVFPHPEQFEISYTGEGAGSTRWGSPRTEASRAAA